MRDKIQNTLPMIPPARLAKGSDLEFFRMIDESLNLAIAILDENLTYQYIGQGIFWQLGLPEGSLKVGDTIQDCHELMIKHGLLSQEDIDKNKISIENSAQVIPKNRIVTRLGNGRLTELIRKSLPSGHIVSMSNDITDLVETDQMLDQALRLGNAGYWTYNFQTKAYHFSTTLKEYFSAEELTEIDAHGIITSVHKDDRHIFRNALTNIVNTHDTFNITARNVSSRFGTNWVESTGKLIRNSAGRPLYLRVFVKDVTKDHAFAEELKKAKDKAIAASQAKSSFLANMSHEIRTPMNGIVGMAGLLTQTELNAQQQEYVSLINSSATALMDIINDILDFSKIEAGALEIASEPMNLSESISDVLSLLHPKAQEKGLELIIKYPAQIPRGFIGDTGRIRQVIMNLVGNAIKFTQRGHVFVNVSCEEIIGNTYEILVDVADTGIGIKKDKIDNIFHKFTQADGSTTRLYGGTGLGLSISKKIVELMNGRMSAKSDYGKGSTFSFTLPLQLDPVSAFPTYDISLLQEKHVLIIDGFDLSRSILSEQISQWGLYTETVDDEATARTAIEAANAKNTPYDIILLNDTVPTIPAQDLAAVLSATKTPSCPPIVLLCSSAPTESNAELRSIGIYESILKPVSDARLFKALTHVLVAHPELGSNLIQTKKSVKNTSEEHNTLQQSPRPNQKIDILVAEDFALNQDVVRLMLSHSNFKPVFAKNGREAVELYSKNPTAYALILMDISMPVLDGYQATNLIRSFTQKNNLPHIPIIALTGHALIQDREKCLEAGMDDYLSKPVRQNQLIEKLEAWHDNSTSKLTAQLEPNIAYENHNAA